MSSDGAADVACENTCVDESAFRCSDTGGVQICASQHGCLRWLDVGVCPEAHLCCAGLCVSIDETNCYGCGTRCPVNAPLCQKELGGCGCDAPSCAALGRICDARTHSCVTEMPPPGYDYYVNAAAASSGSGTAASDPFRTITEAVRAPHLAAHKSIYVSPGTYDASVGEAFPIVLRGDVSLVGAGRDRTEIVGIGPYPAPGNGTFFATVVAGDSSLPVHVSGFTLRPPVPLVIDTYFGVYCDRGNAAFYGAPKVTPNTLLDSLRIGPGYGNGISAFYSGGSPTGCNLRLTSSMIYACGTGIYADGCVTGALTSDGAAVALELGDGTPAGGNDFAEFNRPDLLGAGLRAYQCVTSVSAWYNRFRDANAGVEIYQVLTGEPFGSFLFQGNHFERLNNVGLWLIGAPVVVEDLSDNSFESISTVTRDPSYPAAALSIQGVDENGYPVVKRARQNHFIGNDIAVNFSGPRPFASNFPRSDFGTPSDDGANVFRCNATVPIIQMAAGGDVVVNLSAASVPEVSEVDGGGVDGGGVDAGLPSVSFPFAGNAWDHVWPSTAFVGSGVASNGADIMTVWERPVTLDTSAATLALDACPQGRSP